MASPCSLAERRNLGSFFAVTFFLLATGTSKLLLLLPLDAEVSRMFRFVARLLREKADFFIRFAVTLGISSLVVQDFLVLVRQYGGNISYSEDSWLSYPPKKVGVVGWLGPGRSSSMDMSARINSACNCWASFSWGMLEVAGELQLIYWPTKGRCSIFQSITDTVKREKLARETGNSQCNESSFILWNWYVVVSQKTHRSWLTFYCLTPDQGCFGYFLWDCQLSLTVFRLNPRLLATIGVDPSLFFTETTFATHSLTQGHYSYPSNFFHLFWNLELLPINKFPHLFPARFRITRVDRPYYWNTKS